MDRINDDEYFVGKIIECINIIQRFYSGKNIEDLEKDILLNNTIMFQFILISEYSTRLSQEFKNEKNNIPWNKIKGLRNSVVHAYNKVIYKVVDDTIINDLPILKKELLKK